MIDDSAEAAIESAKPVTLWDRLWAPCDVASIAFFRVVFALTVLGHISVYFADEKIEYYFGLPLFHMKFFGFEWIHTLDLDGMRRVYYLMAISAIGVGLGFLYRVNAVLLFTTFTYTILAEESQFQNHYYLMCLIAFLLILIPAHRSFSVDAILVPDKASPWIPNWCRWLMILQLAIPYFYGGIAKLNGDWLHAMPVGLWLTRSSDLPIIGPWLTERWAAWFISYFGVIFDLSVVPLLLWRRTRILACMLVAAFHLSNSILFDIDVFPWMMIFATPLFFSASWPRQLLKHPIPSADPAHTNGHQPGVRTGRQQLVIAFTAVYILWQLVFPFRHLLYPGSPSWTEEGQNFSWRMMLRRKNVFFRIYAKDGPSQRFLSVPVAKLMTSKQASSMCVSPAQLVACAPFFAEQARRQGVRDVEIYAVILTSLNGRKAQLQIDPNLNLLSVDLTLGPQQGIVPLTEPRREEEWDVPIADWPDALGIPLPVQEQTSSR